jgi:hypothetical protein
MALDMLLPPLWLLRYKKATVRYVSGSYQTWSRPYAFSMRLQHLSLVLLPLGGVQAALSNKLQPANSTVIAPKKFIIEASEVRASHPP